jgi:hypothetical protein
MESYIVGTILKACNQSKLLLGCRRVNSMILTVSAMEDRGDVLHDCGSYRYCTNVANGVGWYFSDSYSWGFVSDTDSVDRYSCDIEISNADYRLCWSTNGDSGYRCRATTSIDSDATWEKVIY